MPAVPPETLIGIWYRAQEAELGVAVRLSKPNVDDVRRMANLLYNARRDHGDPSLDEIMICLPEGAQELFLVKKTVELSEVLDA